MKRTSFLPAATAALLMAVTLQAAPAPTPRSQDWPQFRGPTGEGLAGQGPLPTRWSGTDNVVWKQAIPGKGWSSPVVVAGRVYLTTSVPVPGTKALSLRVLCLDAATGKQRWQKEVFREDTGRSPRIHGKNSHASPTPLVDGKRLYVHFGHQGTACLTLDGDVVWRNTIRYKPVHGNGGSPILVGDVLVFSCDGGDGGFLIGLDRATGKERWRTPRSVTASRKFSFSTPLLIEVKGQKQIISPASDMVGAYDPATGREIWRVRYDGYSVIPRPVYGHGLLFFSTGYDSPVLLAIRADGRGDVTSTHIVWKMRKGAPNTPSPLLVGDELYVVSDGGVASCLDAQTGRVHWQQRIGGNYSASPLYGDGKVYFQSEQGTGVVVKAGKEYKLLARNALGERSLASYAAANGSLFIRTASHLYRIGSGKTSAPATADSQE